MTASLIKNATRIMNRIARWTRQPSQNKTSGFRRILIICKTAPVRHLSNKNGASSTSFFHHTMCGDFDQGCPQDSVANGTPRVWARPVGPSTSAAGIRADLAFDRKTARGLLCSIAPFLLQGGSQLQSWNLAGTVKTVFGAECMAYQQGCLGTLTNHPFSVYTNGTLAATFDSSQNLNVTGNITAGRSLMVGNGGTLISTGAGGTMESLIAKDTVRIVPSNTVGCVDQTATAPGATTEMKVAVSPVSPQRDVMWAGYVSASNTVDIRVCTILALGSSATTFNWSVIP
jgi:hypothetical protein